MRLTCPNCDAQYEVDDAVIPYEGRDVQCSNCGHTWFQRPNGATAEGPAPAPRTPEPETVGWHEEPRADDDIDGDSGADHDLHEEGPAAPSAPATPRRELDASVLNILKEEAEREQRAREQEATTETFSSQPDLGLDRATMVPSEPADVAPAPSAAATATPRRDVLPDIEEINSTLNASSDRGADSIVTAEEKDAQERSAFRRGFGIVVLLAAVALALYLLAPNIGGLHPTLEGPMAAYTDFIDGVRVWLNTAVPQALEGATRALEGDGT
ncbi:MAG: zinc-ribbon domain-containing protein [Rhodovulum sp.]